MHQPPKPQTGFFWRGPRGYVFLPEELKPGDWLEFCGDKVSTTGKRKFNRFYREMISVTESEIIVKPVVYDKIGRMQALNVDPPDHDTSSTTVPVARPAPAQTSPLSGYSNEALLAEGRRRGLM